jgi:hypothetical protein
MRTGTKRKGQLVKYWLSLLHQPVVFEISLCQPQNPGPHAILPALGGYLGVSQLGKCLQEAAHAALLQS